MVVVLVVSGEVSGGSDPILVVIVVIVSFCLYFFLSFHFIKEVCICIFFWLRCLYRCAMLLRCRLV